MDRPPIEEWMRKSKGWRSHSKRADQIYILGEYLLKHEIKIKELKKLVRSAPLDRNFRSLIVKSWDKKAFFALKED